MFLPVDFSRALEFADDSTVYAKFSSKQKFFNKSKSDPGLLTRLFKCANTTKSKYMIFSDKFQEYRHGTCRMRQLFR